MEKNSYEITFDFKRMIDTNVFAVFLICPKWDIKLNSSNRSVCGHAHL